MARDNIKYILIRDDDITPFTRADMLDKIYGDLFSKGLPVNFSVIPRVSTDIRYNENSPYSPYKKYMGLEYSPMIPPQHRGRKVKKSFEENQDLLCWMRERSGNIEILQHGFDHNHIGKRNEFAIYDEQLIKSKLIQGCQIIQKDFNVKPKYFVAPSDSISFVTLKALKQNYKGISLWQFDMINNILGEIKRRFSPGVILDDVKAYLQIRKIKQGVFLWDDFLILEHPGYIFSPFKSPKDIESNFLNIFNKNEIIVLVNHHWEYFFDWNDLDKDFYQVWRKIIKFILERDYCKVVTFSQLYNELGIGR